jgi:sugar phosphate permease
MAEKIKEKFMYGYNAEQFKKFKKYAWLMLLSFSLLYLFFYNGRQNINLVKTDMAAAFGFFLEDGVTPDIAPIGVVSSALFWCYAFGQLVSGRIGALLGYKKTMMIGVVASAGLNIALSFATNLTVIAILWGLNGFFQAMVWANGVGVINKWWPKKDRGFASGLATSFSGLAQVVTYYTIFLVMETNLNLGWGWKAAFRFPMIPMLLMLIAFFFFFKTTPEEVGLAPFEEEDAAAAERDAALANEISGKGFFYPYKVLFSEPKVIVFCLISAIAGIGRYALLSLVPTYFTEKMALDFGHSITKIVFLPLGQACAMFVFPFITDKVFKGKREPMLILASVVTFGVMLCFPFINNPALASAMLFVVGVSGMVTGVIWAIAGDMGGRAFAATVVGVLDWAVYMGPAIQVSSFGYLKNALGWPAVFITIGALYIVMLVLTLLARKMKMKKL